jgi:2-polyprenyl-3-methyl-5-hydroxy-6-metoxy-1,4-benzoquinol methylase
MKRRNDRETSNRKLRELDYENRRYGSRSIEIESQPVSRNDFERRYLTPQEEGGCAEGLVMSLAFNKLTEWGISGKRVLDYCCGNGFASIYLAQSGATVYGFDISNNAISLARLKMSANHVANVQFDIMDAENLCLYQDDFFDAVIGIQALHQVVLLPGAGSELARVLKPGAPAIFADNWGANNFLFQAWRSCTTLRKLKSKARGQIILSRGIIRQSSFEKAFEIQVYPCSLFYLLKRRVKTPKVLKAFRTLDAALLRAVYPLGHFCGEAVIEMSKRQFINRIGEQMPDSDRAAPLRSAQARVVMQHDC